MDNAQQNEADHDYESLPDHASAGTHMLAGGAAGMLEHTVMFPFDVIKTRLQTSNQYSGMINCAQSMLRHEGPSSFFNGIRAVLLGAGPAHALYFSAYEQGKVAFNAHDHHISGNVGAAVCATVAHDSFMNPIEVIKQRMQVHNSPYRSVVDCVMRVAQREGVGAFYRSFSTSLIMNIPFHSAYIVLYDNTQRLVNPSGEYSPSAHFVAGAFAGGLAAAVTTPLDVCKTYLNTNEQCRGAKVAGDAVSSNFLTGAVIAARNLYRRDGWIGFTRGWAARMMFTAPAGAISWSVYEAFKHFIQHDVEEPPTHHEAAAPVPRQASTAQATSA
ncbi:uncharacterized protein MONBRDRAFT_37999 [Monosiga brevicollis MX1]|uniref:Mitochondrial carrier protein n=1 Tax=Monosiga brevicollis TaxID=81824 RepID=A9V539_MONBE|nr:uncharacterized protein MONBRDRAFT_37999 [Monosiga brevicollis MX1]EDQ87313.1 predicted protein [Monosiga brevicollis MX1]|eukprot:XP_001747926.1 hypothetical protein [Monosiga brevicollis MX1]